MNFGTLTLAATAIGALVANSAYSAEYTLRIQTHHSPETVSGKAVQKYVDDVETMSGGRVDIELFWSASVVPSVETFDAAASGILDGDFTGGSYQTGKNPAFQFVGDPMGGYDTPWQLYNFFYNGGGQEAANALYEPYNMHLVSWFIPGQESLSSAKPIRGFEDLKDWKFRSPPGLETEIFAGLGAKPIVMDFTEIFTALETGIIDGADASSLANNVGLGLYDIVKHATYPGFHSMPADHIAINLDVWNGLPPDIQRIFEVAGEAMAFNFTLNTELANEEAAVKLVADGVTLHDWSTEDRAKFREIAQKAWDGWAAKTPEAAALVDSHREFQRRLGLIQ